jgi:hypothetical protein
MAMATTTAMVMATATAMAMATATAMAVRYSPSNYVGKWREMHIRS